MTASAQAGPAVGVVLAGGSSRRMGRDKAALRIEGESLRERSLRLLQAVVPEVLVADRGRSPGSVGDGPGRGPVAGILGAADSRPGRSLLVLACDLPLVSEALLATLLARDGDWVVPRWHGRLEPLCSLYRPRALAALRRRVAAGRYALHPLAASSDLSVHALEGAALRRLGEPSRLFFNLNTAKDLELLLAGPRPVPPRP